jgi:glycine/D-amino acid oxidase-like deaminating enzyme
VRLPGSPPSATEADAVVLGAGIAALAAALELARRGAGVIVVRAGAPVAPPLGLMLLGPGRPYAAVAQAISRPAARLVWAAGCENQLRAKALVESLGVPCGYVARGSFLLARSRREAEALEESEDMLREDGFPGEFLDHYMFETRFDASGLAAAYWAAEDAEIDAAALRAALEAEARRRGVAFAPGLARALRVERSVVHVELDQGRIRAASAVVAPETGAAGFVPELAPLLRPLGARELSLAPLEGARLPGAVRTADGVCAWQEQDRGLRLAATAARAPVTGTGTPDAAEQPLLDLASLMPVTVRAADGAAEAAGEIPLDGLPALGLLPGRPVAVACGFGRLPCGLAFAAARFAADALLRGTDPTPDPLRATRTPRAAY